VRFVLENSLLLIFGAVVALVWVNAGPASYASASQALAFAVNDIGMVFFFALAMQKVVMAMRPGGPLGSFRQAGLPVLAAVGGMAGPALIYTAAAHALNRPDILGGWAIPCATDIAFSYLAARLAFRGDHPAIPFLLFLAIADDALGLIVLAAFYPAGAIDVVAMAAFLRSRSPGFCAGVASGISGSTSQYPPCCRGWVCISVASIRRWRWCRSCRSCRRWTHSNGGGAFRWKASCSASGS